MKRNIAKFIDHTFLNPAGEREAIVRLCREAKEASFASVCVNPAEIRTAARLLRSSGVKVCGVVDFPLGQGVSSVRIAEARTAIRDGADELDFVINQRLLKYEPERCLAELKAQVAACRKAKRGLVLKLILECCNLTRDEIVRGCRIAEAAGFDFVKTSTGFGRGGATVGDVKLMRRSVGKAMGVKAAGGLRDRRAALAMLAAGATRLGASAGLNMV